MDLLQQIFITVALVEAIIEAFTMLKDEFDVKMVIAGGLGGLFAFLFNIDLLGFLGLELVFGGEIPAAIFNVAILGLVFLRHAGNLNNLLEWVKGLRPE